MALTRAGSTAVFACELQDSLLLLVLIRLPTPTDNTSSGEALPCRARHQSPQHVGVSLTGLNPDARTPVGRRSSVVGAPPTMRSASEGRGPKRSALRLPSDWFRYRAPSIIPSHSSSCGFAEGRNNSEVME